MTLLSMPFSLTIRSLLVSRPKEKAGDKQSDMRASTDPFLEEGLEPNEDLGIRDDHPRRCAEAISLGGEGFNEWVPVPHGTCHQPNLEA